MVSFLLCLLALVFLVGDVAAFVHAAQPRSKWRLWHSIVPGSGYVLLLKHGMRKR